jgi:hypothetical protein
VQPHPAQHHLLMPGQDNTDTGTDAGDRGDGRKVPGLLGRR